MSISKATVGLLIFALVATALAWRLQASAASDLKRASEFQGREVPESDSEPPDLGAYADILDTLNESITIRRNIDELLGQVEDVVSSLQHIQNRSANVSDLARLELAAIGESLGGGVQAARSSLARLGRLDGSLGKSLRLARLIAEELEELDESLGPSAGKP